MNFNLCRVFFMVWLMFYSTAFCELELDDFISSEDLQLISEVESELNESEEVEESEVSAQSFEHETATIPEVDCLGWGIQALKIITIFVKRQRSKDINVKFTLFNRKTRNGTKIPTGNQYNINSTNFNATLPTTIIIHGFHSYGKADWILNMTDALLEYDDINVISVDWHQGGSTWLYWRAVENTRTVGIDVGSFLQQIINTTDVTKENFHCVGHSLGAHICSFASNILGGIKRITGLDPAGPCFNSSDKDHHLDKSDAEFVDVIHTNGRDNFKIGFGLKIEIGHQDFYPNGGKKQPGCDIKASSTWAKISKFFTDIITQSVCDHGRSYLLFTESLKENNCSLIGREWNRTSEGVNASVQTLCDEKPCSELGMRSNISPVQGSFYVTTTPEEPFCADDPVERKTRKVFFSNLQKKGILSKFTFRGWFQKLINQIGQYF